MAHLEVKPRSSSNWVIWLIIVILVVAAALFFWHRYGEGQVIASDTDTTKTVTDSTKVTVDSTKKVK